MKRLGLPVIIFTIIALVFFGVKMFSTKKNQEEIKSNNITVQEISVTPTTVVENSQKMIIDQNKTYQATLKTTEGDITISLNAKQTPITVNNFVSLSKKNFYDNTIFHRVIKGFMIQGGDPKGNGTGDAGYKFDDEQFEGEYVRGTVAMANSGPNTNGSQFFIMHQDNALPKNYVIFGKVTAGIETVDKIAEAPVKQNPLSGENSVPVTPVSIKSIVIVEK